MAKNKTRKHADTPKRSDADRRVRQAARLADHLRVLQLLLGRGRWDYASLAAELQCSERTIRRRLAALELAGVPAYYDQQLRCIRVRPGVKFPVLQLSRDELLEQATTATVARTRGLDVGTGSVAAAKLAASSADEVAQLLADAERVMKALDLKLADHGRHREMLKTIQWALIERRQLAGLYKTPYQDQPVELTLHPLRLCLTGQAWYLIARPVARDEAVKKLGQAPSRPPIRKGVRGSDSEPVPFSHSLDVPKTYRVMRFQRVRMLDAAAEVPEQFDLDGYFGNAWNVFRGETSYDVDIEFTPDAAEIVTETTWHKTQRIERLEDGGVRLMFTVDGLDEIVWWVLGWSGRAKVHAPEELREMVMGRLRDALQLNAGNT